MYISLLVYHIKYKVIKPFGQAAALYGDLYFTYALLTDRKQAVMNDHYCIIIICIGVSFALYITCSITSNRRVRSYVHVHTYY